ncbi:GAF domain-containing protein [Oculatella sp. LEGE 06141]|uniref:GAF domain-containing protein n=1 Tax=Oculatella sp. LEGE 06141 TaxID=1828648 RepID=UPI00187DEDF4|nr:GAF domain-containing protein [Oculatella sp. LEGE 06141]
MARIVVAEDESVAAWYLREALEHLGHTVLGSVASGSDVIQVTGETRPDLVLMDIRLEGNIDGVAAAQQIREYFDIPVIYITAHTDDSTLHRAMMSEPFGYIIKPFQEKELQTAIAIALHRHQLEKRLRESEQRLATTLASIGDGAIATDSDGCITFINPVAEDLTGWRQPEAIGESSSRVLDLINAKTREAIANPVLRAMQQGINVRLPQDCLLRTKDGAETPIGDTAAPIRNQQGDVTGGIIVFQDVSERIQLEQALRQQAERERLVSDTAQRIRESLDLETILRTTVAEVCRLLSVDRVLIYQLERDRPGTIAAEAAAFARMGTTTSEPSGFAGHSFAPALHQAFSQGHVQVSSDINQDEYLNQHPEYLDDLRQLNVQSQITVPIQQSGSLWGVLIVHQVQTQRNWQPWEIDVLQQLVRHVAIAIQQAQRYQQVQRLNVELAQQVQDRTTTLERAFEFEATLKRIADSVRDSLDDNHILQTAVRNLAIALGVGCCSAAFYSAEQGTFTIQSEYVSPIAPMPGRTEQQADSPEYEQILRGQPLQCCPLTAHSPESRASILASPILDDQGVIGDLWLIDHSDRIFSEQELRLLQQVANQCAIAMRQAQLYAASQVQVRELERLNRLKEDFLSTISHELRTPLANIIMAVQMLEVVAHQQGTLDMATSQVARYFQILREECKREIKLVDDLLGFPHLDAGTEPLVLGAVNLQAWIPFAVELFQDRINERQQILQIDIPADLPALTTDLSILSHILSELLNNACTYTPVGGTIGIAAWATAEAIFLSVSNVGVEIPSVELPHIFDKFYRVPNHDPWRYTGTGLGLALVKKRTEYLGASIQAESGNNSTTFALRFPRQLSSAQPPQDA